MKNTSPQVSIIMATYNRAHFIEETLHSIVNQYFKEWECIIIDDGGTDNTAAILAPILEKDPRFKFTKRPDTYGKGLPGCRNYGLDTAKGKYVIFFDDDDIVHPQNLEICVTELEKSTYDFCRYQRAAFEGEFNINFPLEKDYSSFEISKRDVLKMLNNTLPFNSCAVMWRAASIGKNRFVEHLMYAEEWELYSRLLSQGFNGISVDKTLFYGRKHPNSNTGEFYSGNPVRKKSKIDACKLIVSNLNNRELLNPAIQKYFAWEAVQLKSKELLNHLKGQSTLSFKERLKASFLYAFSPLIKVYLRSKK